MQIRGLMYMSVHALHVCTQCMSHDKDTILMLSSSANNKYCVVTGAACGHNKMAIVFIFKKYFYGKLSS